MHTQSHKTEEFQLIKFLTVSTIKMAKIQIKKIKSSIGATKRQKNTLQALGLGKMNSVVEHEDNKPIMGMVGKVSHLVSVERVK
jgi:large subunit ribosomal protein L30